MYGARSFKLGLFGANCSPAGPSRWCRNAGSALLAQLVIVSLGARCRARDVNAALAFTAAAVSCSARVWHRALPLR